MGLFDKVKNLAKGREKQISQAADKAGDAANKRTGGKYASQIDQAGDKLDEALGVDGDPQTPGRSGSAARPDADPPARPAG